MYLFLNRNGKPLKEVFGDNKAKEYASEFRCLDLLVCIARKEGEGYVYESEIMEIDNIWDFDDDY